MEIRMLVEENIEEVKLNTYIKEMCDGNILTIFKITKIDEQYYYTESYNLVTKESNSYQIPKTKWKLPHYIYKYEYLTDDDKVELL